MLNDQNYTQVCVWRATLVGQSSVKEFEKFFQEDFGVRVKYLEEVKTFPDVDKFGEPVEGSGGRNDVLFYIHREDIPKFAIPRFSIGVSWLEDVIDNSPNIYPDRVKELRAW